MILRIDRLQTEMPPPSDPDPAGAAVVQELLGGKFGEMSTFMNYTFQSFNFRNRQGARPFYDLVANIAAEEFGHIELVSTAINTMLTGAGEKGSLPKPSELLNPQHFAAGGAGTLVQDSNGTSAITGLRHLGHQAGVARRLRGRHRRGGNAGPARVAGYVSERHRRQVVGDDHAGEVEVQTRHAITIGENAAGIRVDPRVRRRRHHHQVDAGIDPGRNPASPGSSRRSGGPHVGLEVGVAADPAEAREVLHRGRGPGRVHPVDVRL